MGFVAKLALVFLLGLGLARAEEVEVIQLRYRTADQVIPMLNPLVEPGGGLTGMQNALVIRASRKNIEQLRQVVATLDRMPRRLLISVRQDAAASMDARGASVTGTGGSGDVRVGVNEPARRDPGASVNVYDSRSSRDERMTSQVQALEGSPAYISVGQSVPLQGTTVTRTPSGTIVQNTTSYQNIGSGFYVTPRVAGDRVFLDIATQSASPGRYGPGSANVQQTANTISARLGEWVPLGGIDQSALRSQSGTLYGTQGARSMSSSVWVKVDEIQ
jgi:Bacterial type II and III secretion system protein/Bacterial type II/III secretion system short domain